MARIRTVKPDFFRHEGLQDLEKANPGSYVMLVFEGLWTLSDKAGRFEWKPRTIKLDVLPFLDFDMEKTLMLLGCFSFISQYEDNGKLYGVVNSFEEHQRINGKEAQEPPKYPEPKFFNDLGNGSNREAIGKQQRSQEGKGTDIGNGMDIPPRKFSDDDLSIANLIHAKLLEIDQKAKKPNFDKWADDIRMMRERDKRTPEEIKAVFMFANQDSFWRTNILSPGKLREKFTTLLAKKAQVENAANRQNTGTGQNGYDNRSRTQRVADKLDAIAKDAVRENGFTERVD